MSPHSSHVEWWGMSQVPPFNSVIMKAFPLKVLLYLQTREYMKTFYTSTNNSLLHTVFHKYHDLIHRVNFIDIVLK